MVPLFHGADMDTQIGRVALREKKSELLEDATVPHASLEPLGKDG